MSTLRRTLARSERPVLKIRRPSIRLSALTPHYWFADNPVATHFMNALSCLLSPSESFFIRSMIAYRSRITDRELRLELRDFTGQESVHGHEYDKVNQWLDDYGLPASRLTRIVDEYLRRLSRVAPAKICIAHTAAFEHIVAAISHGLLSDRNLIQKIHPDVRSLWLWHAIEEIEHKSVAFDVARLAGVGYFMRCVAMLISIVSLIFVTLAFQFIFLTKDAQIFNLKACMKFIRMVYKNGVAQRVSSYIGCYFRRDFHPWQLDERPLIHAGGRMLEESLLIQREVLTPSVQSPLLTQQLTRIHAKSIVPKTPPFRHFFPVGSDNNLAIADQSGYPVKLEANRGK